jgi:hypothetical protein
MALHQRRLSRGKIPMRRTLSPDSPSWCQYSPPGCRCQARSGAVAPARSPDDAQNHASPAAPAAYLSKESKTEATTSRPGPREVACVVAAEGRHEEGSEDLLGQPPPWGCLPGPAVGWAVASAVAEAAMCEHHQRRWGSEMVAEMTPPSP